MKRLEFRKGEESYVIDYEDVNALDAGKATGNTIHNPCDRRTFIETGDRNKNSWE